MKILQSSHTDVNRDDLNQLGGDRVNPRPTIDSVELYQNNVVRHRKGDRLYPDRR